MARRLLSGWLIALAALARSLALIFERAAAARPEPAAEPDSAMAELAARYPGAPAHWLAHVAEGMARTAKAGEVPLSLTSDAMAWPEAAPASHEQAASSPELASRPPVAGPPRPPLSPPISPPSARRAVEAVPSLEALRNRSSEVWRRPAVAPRRLSRPVFAPPVDRAPPLVTPEEITPIPQRQPRPRLTVAVREAPRTRPDLAESPAPMAETSGSEPDPPAAARPVPDAPPAVKPEPEVRPGTIDMAPPTAHTAPPIRSAAAPPSIATAVEPPISEAPRPATHPEMQRPASSPARRVRRAILKVLAGLRAKPRADRPRTWTRPTLQLVSETPARTQRTVNPPLRTIFPTLADPAVPARRTAPTIQTMPKARPPTAPRGPRLVWSQAPSQVEPPRQASPPSVDGRWPAFPPKTFSPPPVAELPSPRLEQLAREQEEGRWSV